MNRKITVALMTLALVGCLGAEGGCETAPERGTPVIKTTKKPKTKKSKRGTPAVEMHCFTNGGKQTCTPKARS